MTPKLMRTLALAALTLLLPSLLFAAADVVTVGTATSNGTTVDVPVYIRDVAGTSLGVDQPAGSKIQSFSIKVDYAPASSVSSVTFSRSGITGGLSPTSEFKPTSPGSASLLSTFQESTNPIPFTLNAAAPGNKVAHLVFTLSNSAAPGSTITLTLDSSLTQLTDEGGSASTKETVAKGSLSLVNGAIHVAPLALSLSSNVKVQVGKTANVTVTASSNVASATTITLSSNKTNIATVPASVTINSGSKSAIFSVSGVAAGTASITATLPPADGSGSASTAVTVSEQPAPCAVPLAPQLTSPENAASGATYSITWPAVTDATEYSIEEATNDAFSSPTMRTVTTNSASFAHSVTGETRYYYRVTAANRAAACNELSAASATISVLVAPTPSAPAKRIIAVVGSTAGNAGSFFRTSVQMYNPTANTLSGRIIYHPAGASAADGDPSIVYTLAAGMTLTYSDLLPVMGVASGIGSADVLADVGSSFPVTAVRVFNDGGAAGTTGLAQDLLRPEEALLAGQSGALIAPADAEHFRLNLAVRTLEAGATLTITVRNPAGETVKSVQKTFPPSYFAQTSSTLFLDGYALVGGETLSFTVDAGSAFVYGATTDNTTNDPSQQFVHPL